MDGRSHSKQVAVTDEDRLDVAFDALKRYLEFAKEQAAASDTSFQEVEAEVRRLSAMVESVATGQALKAFEPQEEIVEFEGRQYRRMSAASETTYLAMPGRLRVLRHLYREIGVRNGPTIVPLELRTGIVDGLMTPAAAKATAHMLQALTSREAEALAKSLGVVDASRSSIARVGVALGARWEEHRLEGEDALMESFEIPENATAISVSVDRVSMPMEEAQARKPGPPKKGAPKRPIDVVYRMAYCGVLTFHDAEGQALHSIRYGRMPGDEARLHIESAMAGDFISILTLRPELRVVALADGAPEMQNMLDRITMDVPVEARLVDFWHLVEKLSAALRATGRELDPKLGRWKKALLGNDSAAVKIELELRTWALDYEEDELPGALHEALTYLENNRDRMRYAKVHTRNLPIGSGHVEATCKTLVTVRMKRSGARWKVHGGQAIMHLRSLALSSRWDPAMDYILALYRTPVRPVRDAA